MVNSEINKIRNVIEDPDLSLSKYSYMSFDKGVSNTRWRKEKSLQSMSGNMVFNMHEKNGPFSVAVHNTQFQIDQQP